VLRASGRHPAVDVADAPNASTRTQFGVLDRSAQAQRSFLSNRDHDAATGTFL
jgi:hypothetical protein